MMVWVVVVMVLVRVNKTLMPMMLMAMPILDCWKLVTALTTIVMAPQMKTWLENV